MVWHGWQRIEFPKGSLLGLCVFWLRWLLGLRASPRLLLIVCIVQMFVLIVSTLQLLGRSACAILLPSGGPVVIDCESCGSVRMDVRSGILSLIGAGVIGTGMLAVVRRDGKLLYIYGSAMIFFSFLIGLTAVLTALESPVLEVALEGIHDEICLELASDMMYGAQHHAMLASIGCLVDTLGAILAIRSKELFTYEEISASHAEVASSQTL